jgi:hypothetical protein
MLQSAERVTYPARYASSKRPRIMMGECIGHRRTKSLSRSRNLWKGILRRLGSFVSFESAVPNSRIDFNCYEIVLFYQNWTNTLTVC